MILIIHIQKVYRTGKTGYALSVMGDDAFDLEYNEYNLYIR